VDAIGETRHNFMKGITSAANSIAQDSHNKDSDPSATVTQSLVDGLDLPVRPQKSGGIFHF